MTLEQTCENCKHYVNGGGMFKMCARLKEPISCDEKGTCDKWERRYPIKRCPFCGGGAEVTTEFYTCYVQCVSCRAKGASVWMGDEISRSAIWNAVLNWNKRWKG